MSEKVAKQDWDGFETEWTVKECKKCCKTGLRWLWNNSQLWKCCRMGWEGWKTMVKAWKGCIQGWRAGKQGWEVGKQTGVRGLLESGRAGKQWREGCKLGWGGWNQQWKIEKEGWDGWKTGVRRLPKRGEGCKTVLKKRAEMIGKQLCNGCQKGVRVAKQCWKRGMRWLENRVRRLPKRDEGCKTVLEKWDEMFGKEGATVA